MRPEQWARAKELYAELAVLPDASRAEELERRCGDDPALLALLVPMLTHGESRGSFLDESALKHAGIVVQELAGNPAGPDSAIGWRLGPYLIESRIGAGGMGAVYLAQRADGQYDQQVAIKLVKRGLDTEEVLERFRHERQLLANLDHPNIAGLLEGGVAPDGRPYLVMSYIEGRPIDEYCRAHRLSLHDRLNLFCTVCEAVHYAHQNLVVHRDLKPANILVTEDSVPKLLDFGIAKLLGPGADGAPDITAPERRLLTPGFASPEQVLGRAVSTSSDIYSLGVVLFHLLTGEAPYSFTTGTNEELRRVICESDSPAPGRTVRRASKAAGGGGPAARRLHGDLDNIVLMAMRKEPERRYASAEHLAADIRRHLGGHPVLARPSTFGYRAHKFIRRNAIGVAAAAAIGILALGGIGGIAWQAHIARVQRDRAVLAHEQADQINEFLQSILLSANAFSDAGPDVTVRQLLKGADERARRELAGHPTVLAAVLGAVGGAYSSLGLFDQAEPLLRDALAIARPLPAATSEVSARLNDLATYLYAVGEHDEAEGLLRESLDIAIADSGRESGGVASILNNLGAVLRSQGRLDEAEHVLREALEIRRRLLGSEDLAVAETLNNLANILRLRGDLPAAEKMLSDSLHIREAVLGEDHPLVAQSLSNLAVLVHTEGDLDRAGPLYARALELQRRSLGQDHPDRASTLFSYGILLRSGGDDIGAEPVLREALDVRARHFAADDPRVLVSQVELGKCLSALGRHTAAVDLLASALRAAGDGPRRDYARGALADAYEAAGRHDEAEMLR